MLSEDMGQHPTKGLGAHRYVLPGWPWVGHSRRCLIHSWVGPGWNQTPDSHGSDLNNMPTGGIFLLPSPSLGPDCCSLRFSYKSATHTPGSVFWGTQAVTWSDRMPHRGLISAVSQVQLCLVLWQSLSILLGIVCSPFPTPVSYTGNPVKPWWRWGGVLPSW